ncbi:amidase [Nocardia sp. NPDC088792]|uniref:amidase n=1 Tax=Nocardia sp. NPDC088792 TaxID=3364332 RepID=UPI00381A8A79
MEPELQYAGIDTIRRLYTDGTLSPTEYLSTTLELLDRLEPELGAFVTVARERATAEAEAAQRRLHTLGTVAWEDRPLLGMPVSIKDLTPTEGIRTTRGSLLHTATVPTEDAPAVARLRDAGAIIIGKTNTSEGGWSASGVNRVHGPTRNPWDPSRTPGGSSAGAAVAVAMGVGVAGTGTDGAGSIRIPAAFCGVVGFKPTLGRIPYVPASPDELSHIGPLTRTVDDAVLLLRVMSGFDARDALTFRTPCPTAESDTALSPRTLRIGWISSLGAPDPHPEIEALARRAAQSLTAWGHVVEEIAPPFEDPYPMLEVILSSWESATHADDLAGVADRLDPDRLQVIRFGGTLDATQLVQAYAGRSRLRTQVHDVMTRYDLLAMPTVPIPPFAAELHEPAEPVRKGRLSWLAWTPGTYPFNLTGQPAVSVPAGLTTTGLPVGLQLVGSLHADALVLAVARQLEQLNPWHHLYAELSKRWS